jgi:hypothetical protein
MFPLFRVFPLYLVQQTGIDHAVAEELIGRQKSKGGQLRPVNGMKTSVKRRTQTRYWMVTPMKLLLLAVMKLVMS